MIIASCQHEISIEWFNDEKSCIQYNDFDNGKKVIISSVVCPKCRKRYERKGLIIEKLKQPTESDFYYEITFDKKHCYKFERKDVGLIIVTDENKEKALQKMFDAIKQAV